MPQRAGSAPTPAACAAASTRPRACWAIRASCSSTSRPPAWDPEKREDLWRTIQSLAADGCTVLLTTPYLEEADALADEITVIDHGSVIAHDTPAGLKHLAGGRSPASSREIRP
ncbi:hypothetical protein ACO0LV_09235 [Pseudactinotalea sp. Z1739]|uniref:hypothetical protein n=1 Tax=Pseudactinotalea sp. Z1739 TaxID=3413028 RepID=UPI003C7C3B9B